MPLQLILGSAGTGKSHLLYKEMIRCSGKDRDGDYLVIVPEQFTMQTQKDMVRMHPDHGVMNIDILSFLRLAYHVFEETRTMGRPVLEDLGKSMLVRKVLEEKKDSLLLFGRSVRKAGFVDEVKSLLSEMMQYSIGAEELAQMISITEKKPLLQGKLKELAILYQGFRDLLSERYITAEEILTILYDVLDRSERIRNSVICFDGFTGFTPSQYKVLEKLLTLSKKVAVTVTIDGREDVTRVGQEFELFHLSHKTIHKLMELARGCHTEVLEPIWAGGRATKPVRFLESKALMALEHNLFRYPQSVYGERQEDIGIHCVRDGQGEVDFTIRQIRKLIKEKGWHYRDIAVVTGDIGYYGRVIEKKYEAAGIPFFLDRKRDILSNPMVELLRSLIEVLEKDFQYNGIFRFLRCGLSGIDRNKTDLLENYVLALGIRGYKKWSQPFTRMSQRNQAINLEEINQCRELVMEKLSWIRDRCMGKGRTVRDLTEGFYEYLVREDIFHQLAGMQDVFQKNGERLKAKEYQQVYGLVLEVFDRLAELLGGDKVSIKEYGELLEVGFSEAKVGLIPPGVDQVVVGDIERTRLKDIKALFFIGVNDGIIPKAGGSSGILSDMERNFLKEFQIELAPTGRQKELTQQFYLYLNLTKPSHKLYLTYAKIGPDGKAKSPSYLIGKIKALFPELCIVDEDRERLETDYILGGDQGLSYLLEGIGTYREREMTLAWKELYSYYLGRTKFQKEVGKLLDGAFYTSKKQMISRKAAGLLYGNELHHSVTRLEKYAECGFAHFLAYGLGLLERKEYRLNVPDIGNIFHNAIEWFSKRLAAEGLTWHTITDQQRDRLAEEAVEEVTKEYGNTIFLSSKRNEYMIKRILRMTKRSLWAISQQIQAGELEPSGYEIVFSPYDNLSATVLKLSERETMRLGGRIDRLDTYEDDENVYIKVVDYKSGSTSFDLNKVYYGLQLQLVVYLKAALELEQKRTPGKTIIPAGIFYYNIDDPVIDRPVGDYSQEEIGQRILEELKMNGLSNGDRKVLSLMDRIFLEEKSVKSRVIPVELTAKGEYSAYSAVADEEQFRSLCKFVEKKITLYGKEILDGNAAAEPYQMKQHTACDYCSYKDVCGFDKKLPGSHYRNLSLLDKEEVWNEIKEKGGDA